ncbi:MAG: hypothetical protein EON90_02585 [Brevundimonas sp.]|nr:MAG: hypothetical protein EON90_02585 [Brevundimonas sp.]
MTQLVVQALLLLNGVNYLKPDLLSVPGPLALLLMIAVLAWASIRRVRTGRLTNPDLPVLQRVTMGDATDEDRRRNERDGEIDRAWLFGSTWWVWFLLAHVAILLPWPSRWAESAPAPDLRVALLFALHLGTSLYVVHLWLRARTMDARR